MVVSRSPRLVAETGKQVFGHKDQQAFEAALVREQRNTQLVPVTTPDDLLLNEHYRTRSGGLQLSKAVIQHVCQLICPQLAGVLLDLSTATDSNPATAAWLWNEFISMRFAKLQSQVLVQNTASRVAVSLCSTVYQHLDHVSFYTAIQTATQQRQLDCVFWSAIIHDAACFIWFRSPGTCYEGDYAGTPWRFYAGYHWSNDIQKQSAVQGSLALFSRAGVAVSRPQMQLRHTGRKFQGRLDDGIQAVLATAVDVAAVSQGFDDMTQTSLDYDPSALPKAQAQQVLLLTKKLTADGLPRQLANRVATVTLEQGVYCLLPSHAVPSVVSLVRGRVVLDIFAALLWVSRQLTGGRRRSLEQLAYRLINKEVREYGTKFVESAGKTQAGGDGDTGES